MLVDRDSGALMAVSHRALAAHRHHVGREAGSEDYGAEGGLEQELFLTQIETGTSPCASVDELRADILACRQRAAESADTADAGLVAVGAPVLADSSTRVTPQPRYERIVAEFGEIGREGAVCGMHVHVDVSDGEAVAVLDGLRPWLPVLRALSVNSPFWRGKDTGYASWRTQMWGRWPTAGPAEPFGDRAAYDLAADLLVVSGAALDRGMLYFDARLAEDYPTVEVRVFDAITEVDDVLMLAALTRALVETIGSGGESVPEWRTNLLAAAHWRSSRYGVEDSLVHPMTFKPESARTVIEDTLAFAGDALDEFGDTDFTREAVEQLFARGTGAARQRSIVASGGDLKGVVADLGERFAASLPAHPAD